MVKNHELTWKSLVDHGQFRLGGTHLTWQNWLDIGPLLASIGPISNQHKLSISIITFSYRVKPHLGLHIIIRCFEDWTKFGWTRNLWSHLGDLLHLLHTIVLGVPIQCEINQPCGHYILCSFKVYSYIGQSKQVLTHLHKTIAKSYLDIHSNKFDMIVLWVDIWTMYLNITIWCVNFKGINHQLSKPCDGQTRLLHKNNNVNSRQWM